jgi:hypothetical protein
MPSLDVRLGNKCIRELGKVGSGELRRAGLSDYLNRDELLGRFT